MSKKPDSKKPGDSQTKKKQSEPAAPEAAAKTGVGRQKAGTAAAGAPGAAKSAAAPGKASLSISLGKALLLVGLLLIGVTVYLWTQVLELKYAQQVLVDKATRSSTELVQRELDKMQQTVQASAEAGRKANSALRGSLDKLGRSVRELQKITGREKQGWKLAEAEFLLAVANHSVRLKQDLQTALVALTEADQRLKEINDPKLFAVRKKIAVEIGQLKSVKRPDIDGLVARLDSIVKEAKTLALFASIPTELKTRTAPPEDLPSPEASNDGAKRSVSARFKAIAGSVWEELKTLVVVHHYDRSVPKLLLPEQETAIRQVLDLKLQQARVALLQGRQASYRSALKAVNAWLLEYFDTSDSKVKDALKTVDSLAAQRVTVVLPDISGSLRQIRRFLHPGVTAPKQTLAHPGDGRDSALADVVPGPAAHDNTGNARKDD